MTAGLLMYRIAQTPNPAKGPMSRIIHLLNDLSYAAGLIGLIELQERNEIASWVFSRKSPSLHARPDPRGELEQRLESDLRVEEGEVFQSISEDGQVLVTSSSNQLGDESAAMQFLVLKRWYFTLGDADCAPSVPHGHENSKTQKWPKLNPYTGKVFTAIHNEDTPRRLSRPEMQLLWQDDGFVDHCRQQVAWYADQFPHHKFANARRGILVFPRW